MRKRIFAWWCLAALVAMPVFAQSPVGETTAKGLRDGTAFPASPATGDVFAVTDDSAVGACDSAAGSATTLCRWNGAAWVALGDGGGGGGTPGGSDTHVQYNDGGAFGGQSDLAWNDVTRLLTIGAATGTAGIKLPLQNDAATPTLAFGDGDTGIYERLDDRLVISHAAVGEWGIDASVLGGINCTEPIISTGVGGSGGFAWNCSNNESLYRAGSADVRIESGGVDVLRATATGVTITDVLTITPRASAPASCAIGDFYSDSSGAACACTASNTWENMTATGSCV